MTIGSGVSILKHNHGGVILSRLPASAKNGNTTSIERGRNKHVSTVNTPLFLPIRTSVDPLNNVTLNI